MYTICELILQGYYPTPNLKILDRPNRNCNLEEKFEVDIQVNVVYLKFKIISMHLNL
jgi:hypothetical protein